MSSPLLRARQTAAAFATVKDDGEDGADARDAPHGADARDNANGTAVEVDQRWIEMDYGDLDGRPASALPEEAWRTWRQDPHFVPAGGESVAAVGARVRQASAELVRDAACGDLIVVSHVSPIKAAVAWALGAGDEVAWRMFLLDAAVCRVDTSGPLPLLLAFNEVHG